MSALTLRRPNASTLILHPEHGYLASPIDRLFYDHNHPFVLGDRIELTGVTIEITSLTEDGRPAEAAFHFDVPLEDPSLRWLYWNNEAFVPFTPPAIGETVIVP